MWLEGVVSRRRVWLYRKIIGIKICYNLIKIFLHNKIHFKINSIIYSIRAYIYKVITVVISYKVIKEQ